MKNYRDKGLIGACLEISNNNYGSMLQSFATQKMLEEYGFSYELLKYKKKYTPAFILKSIPRLMNKIVWQDKLNEYEKQKFLRKHPELSGDVRKRKQAYTEFRAHYFSAPVVTYYGYRQLKESSKKYVAFLTGSDQLWSPSGLPTNFYNLMFAEDKAVKISYGSSFGVKEIPWYQKRRTKQYLDRIQFISCREKSGSAIVKQLTGREVMTVADPTMLYDGDTWQEMLPCKTVQEGKYIFSYLLGTSKEYREEILKLSQETGLPVVSIHQYVDADLGFGDVSITDSGPREFVNLIRNAEYVCTDSFHGSVFSILYHKNFVVFNRYADTSSASKNTRIESLCSRLGLSEKRFSGDILQDMKKQIDYMAVDKALMKIRKESRAYLECAFDSIK